MVRMTRARAGRGGTVHVSRLVAARAARERAAGARVLLLGAGHRSGRSYLRALAQATVDVEWVQTLAELEARALDEQTPPPTLVMILSHEQDDHVAPRELAELASRLAAGARARAGETRSRRASLDDALREYCARRGFSPRQERVLHLYLDGQNDKTIADLFSCSETTVYEHWRRMARKAAGFNKGDVVTDFHRFLAGTGHDGSLAGDDG